MAIIRPEFEEERGQAGETRFTTSKKHNFANLYQMNRSDGQLKDKADKMGKDAALINEQMAGQVKQAQMQGPGAAKPGTPGVSQNQVDYNVNQAKQLSNQAQNFSVENEAMKAGQSPYQSAITGFYAGTSNPYVNQIRSFQNTYNTALGKADEIKKLTAINDLGKDVPKPVKTPQMPGLWGLQQQQKNDERNQNLKQKYGDTGFKSTAGDPLYAALRAGKITGDEYYAAQGGPGTPGYDKIKDRLVW